MAAFEIRWQNFRGFEDTGWLRIRPITVLIGPNNSGKTSLLAPLLLLKQTLVSQDEEVSLLTRGELINAGSFENFVFQGASDNDVVLSIRFHGRPRRTGNKPRPVGEEPPGICSVTFGPDEDPTSVVLKSYEVTDDFGRRMLRRNRLASGRYSLLGLGAATKTKRRRKGARGDFENRAIRAIRASQPTHYLFTAEGIFRQALPEPTETEGPVEIELSDRLAQYMSAVDFVRFHMEQLADQIHYIGPLRERPKRLYEISGETPAEVGIRGEFTPEIIFRRRDEDLVERINDWLTRFSFGGRLKCVRHTEGAFSIGFQKSPRGPFVNLADTGFGISQILPLIVEGICAPERTVIMTEQPEIHLNPSLQAELADLFAEVTLSNRGVLLETHSEHLILRLRRLVAEGRIQAKNIALYYVEKVRDQSTVREVPIKGNGHIEPDDWPADFFKEPLRDSLALASAQSRRRSNARRRGS